MKKKIKVDICARLPSNSSSDSLSASKKKKKLFISDKL